MIDSRTDRPIRVIREREPDVGRDIADVLTIFLTASRCPVGCSMCDLHRFTAVGPIPNGAVTDQVRWSLEQYPDALRQNHTHRWIKLYNSGNFFDVNSVPPSDYESIAQLVSGFDRVIVENHPRIGVRHIDEFRSRLSGKLQIAVGLETVQPRWLKRLGKQMTRDDFDGFAKTLRNLDIELRVFLICGVPDIDVHEATRWTSLSIRHAIHCGAQHVSLISARTGEGWNGLANRLPMISPKMLADLQAAAISRHGEGAVITVDTWDLPVTASDDANPADIQRIEAMNLTQVPQ